MGLTEADIIVKRIYGKEAKMGFTYIYPLHPKKESKLKKQKPY